MGGLRILGLLQLNRLWGPTRLGCPLDALYAGIGKKSARAENLYVTDPYPTCLDRYVVLSNASQS